ncbi:transposase [Sphingobacterium sp. UBA1498]|nr:transposase [Sphingobacterium sp. UBA1498]
MKKSKFSEHQIVNILKEYESKKAIEDICKEHGISAATFYQWK